MMVFTGFYIKSREHDSLVNELVIETKARESLGQVVPVGIAPERRAQLEEERESLLLRLARLQEKREVSAFKQRESELRRTLHQFDEEPIAVPNTL